MPTSMQFKGISRKGKNRIAQHGSTWQVVLTGQFQGSPAIFIESLDRVACRWVLDFNDPDFAKID